MFQDLPDNLQGKIAAGGVKEEATIDKSNAADVKEKQDAENKLNEYNSEENKQARSDYYDREPDPNSMSKRNYKKAMEQWNMEGQGIL